MESPLGPQPVMPGLRPHRVLRPSRDRKGKSGSFQDELPDEEHEAPDRPPAPPPKPPAKRRPPIGRVAGNLLDLEA